MTAEDRPNNMFDRADRDLLIKLNTAVDYIRQDIKDLKDNVVGRVERLEANSVTKDDVKAMITENEEDHKKFVLSSDFQLVRNIVFGGAGLILTAVVMAGIYSVMK